MVGGQRRHLQVDVAGCLQLLQVFALEAVEQLGRRSRDVVGQFLHRRSVVVVRLDVPLEHVEDRTRFFEPAREDELMAPHCMPPEFALPGRHSLIEERLALRGAPQRLEDLGTVVVVESRREHIAVLGLFLHRPQQFERIPVPVGRRVLQAPEQRLIDVAAHLFGDGREIERRRQLGEVEHPVDLPMAIVDVDRILKDRGPLHERDLVPDIDLRLEVLQVAVHLGNKALPPPVGEVEPVRGKHGI